MADLVQRLDRHAVIGLDTSVFIYHVESHARYLPLTGQLLAGVQAGRWTAITSTITLMELAVRPWQLGQPAVAREDEVLLVNFPHLTVADMTRHVARRAARLRADHRLRPADAIQAATALVHGATALVTNDRALTRLSVDIDVIVLDDFSTPEPEGVEVGG
jgi:predicted nucleic acid-binding protein